MQSLPERAAQILARLGQAAVPLPELTRLIRETGFAVSEPVLLRALAAEPDRFRVLEPWRAVRRAPDARAEPWAGVLWVVPGGSLAASGQRPALRRLATTLLQLGWRVDPTSAPDVARWFGMVLESERFRSRLSA